MFLKMNAPVSFVMTPFARLLSLAVSRETETNGRGAFSESCMNPLRTDCEKAGNKNAKARKLNAIFRLKREEDGFKKYSLLVVANILSFDEEKFLFNVKELKKSISANAAAKHPSMLFALLHQYRVLPKNTCPWNHKPVVLH